MGYWKWVASASKEFLKVIFFDEAIRFSALIVLVIFWYAFLIPFLWLNFGVIGVIPGVLTFFLSITYIIYWQFFKEKK